MYLSRSNYDFFGIYTNERSFIRQLLLQIHVEQNGINKQEYVINMTYSLVLCLCLFYKVSMNNIREISTLKKLHGDYMVNISYLCVIKHLTEYFYFLKSCPKFFHPNYHSDETARLNNYISICNRIFIDIMHFIFDIDFFIWEKNNTTRQNIIDLLNTFDFELAYAIHRGMTRNYIKNIKNFIYCYFIPYLERHGIDVEGNPEYLAIIRRRIKDIKEPELDF